MRLKNITSVFNLLFKIFISLNISYLSLYSDENNESTCSIGNISFPIKNSRDIIIASWNDLETKPTECYRSDLIIQTALVNCKNEYRCILIVPESISPAYLLLDGLRLIHEYQ